LEARWRAWVGTAQTGRSPGLKNARGSSSAGRPHPAREFRGGIDYSKELIDMYRDMTRSGSRIVITISPMRTGNRPGVSHGTKLECSQGAIGKFPQNLRMDATPGS
jgi:hypothetical protein